MRSASQTRFHWVCLAGGIAALALALGCARSPETITLKTAEGTETVAAPRPATLFSMARILGTSGRHGESERLLLQVLDKHPDFIPAYSELAESLARQRRIEQALSVLQAGLKHAPQDPVLLNNAGMCQLQLKQHVLALELFKKANEAKPADVRYRANLALAQALSGDFKKAQALYETFLSPQETQQNFAIIRKTRLTEIKAAMSVPAGRNDSTDRQVRPALPLIKP